MCCATALSHVSPWLKKLSSPLLEIGCFPKGLSLLTHMTDIMVLAYITNPYKTDMNSYCYNWTVIGPLKIERLILYCNSLEIYDKGFEDDLPIILSLCHDILFLSVAVPQFSQIVTHVTRKNRPRYDL